MKLFDGWFYLCLALSLSVLFLCAQIKPPPRIATVDLASIIDEFVLELGKLELDEVTQLQRVQDFSQQLDRGLARLVQQDHVILLPQAAVLGGANDVTATLKGLLDAPL